MKATLVCFMLLFAWGSSAADRSTELFLSDREIQSVVDSPSKVDAKIEELSLLAQETDRIAMEVSILQTILLLEPYSQNAHCSLGLVYGRVAELLMRIGASDDALNFIHRGLRHEELCSEYDSKRVCTMLGMLGSFHLIAKNLDSSLYYFRIAEHYTDTISDPIWHASAMNNLGMVWMAMGNKDSAYVHYNASVFDLNDFDEAHLQMLGSITDNLALWHEDQKEYELARQRHMENTDRFQTFKDTLNEAKSWLGVARTSWALKEGSHAFAALDSAFHLLNACSQKPSNCAELMVAYYRLMQDFSRSEGRNELALDAADSTMAWEGRHFELDKQALKAIIKVLNESDVSRVNRERRLRKDLAEARDRSYQRLLMFIVASIFAGLLLIVLLFQKGRPS